MPASGGGVATITGPGAAGDEGGRLGGGALGGGIPASGGGVATMVGDAGAGRELEGGGAAGCARAGVASV
jgi:hypothetical protein